MGGTANPYFSHVLSSSIEKAFISNLELDGFFCIVDSAVADDKIIGNVNKSCCSLDVSIASATVSIACCALEPSSPCKISLGTGSVAFADDGFSWPGTTIQICQHRARLQVRLAHRISDVAQVSRVKVRCHHKSARVAIAA